MKNNVNEAWNKRSMIHDEQMLRKNNNDQGIIKYGNRDAWLHYISL